MNYTIAAYILILVFLVLLIIRIPIAVALIVSSTLTVIYLGLPLAVIPQAMIKQVNTFSLLAVPLFIFTGEIMSAGGIAQRLVDFSRIFVGGLRGGLAYVNVLGSTFFGGISGSAVADITSLGVIEIAMMTKDGYDRDFSTALTVSTALQSILIPPSHNMVLYALAAGGGISLGQMFLGGILPGVLLALCLCVYITLIAKKKNFPRGQWVPRKMILPTVFNAFWSLLTLFIIVLGVAGGVFTATESAGIAALYATIVSLFIYRELKFKDLLPVVLKACRTIGMVTLIIASSAAFGWVVSLIQLPAKITSGILSISDNKYIVLLIINLILLFLGMIMDMGPIILVVTPILMPVVRAMEVNLVHFGIILLLNLAIGLTTPPVGTALFVGSAVGEISIERLTKALLPQYCVMVVVLFLVTYIPAITLFLPRIMMGGQ